MYLSTARNALEAGAKGDRSADRHGQGNEYRLQFHGNASGVDKAMEFNAPDIAQAMLYVIEDPARRSVEIWENGAFICTVSRDQRSPAAASCGTRADIDLPKG